MRREIPPPPSPPPLRVPDWPLPPYRYVPGLHPHPFRHPGGHAWTGGGAPAEEPWSPDQRWETDRRYLRGLDLFDHRYYWEAHEGLEALWHYAPRGSADALLLQGLIQGAAFVLKHHAGEQVAAERLLVRATEHLGRAEAMVGAQWRGVSLAALRSTLSGFSTGGMWPLLLDGRTTPAL